MTEGAYPNTPIRVGAPGSWIETTMDALARDNASLATAFTCEQVRDALDALVRGVQHVTVPVGTSSAVAIWRLVNPGDVVYLVPDYVFQEPCIREARVVAQAERSGAVSVKSRNGRPIYDSSPVFLTREAAFDEIYRRARKDRDEAADTLARKESRLAAVAAYGEAHGIVTLPMLAEQPRYVAGQSR